MLGAGPPLVAVAPSCALAHRRLTRRVRLNKRTVIVHLSVVYISCSIHVAWHIRHADQQPACWLDATEALLQARWPQRFPRICRCIVLSEQARMAVRITKLWQPILVIRVLLSSVCSYRFNIT